MKFLNLNDSLSVENLDNIQPIKIALAKDIMDWNLEEIDAYIRRHVNGDLPKEMYIQIDASELKNKISYNFFFTIVSRVLDIILTKDLKFEEKRLGANTEIVSQTTIPLYQLNKLLNYKSKVNYLQVELYRKKKLKISMIE